MRIWIVIVASLVSGCGSVGLQPSAGAIARIETGMAVLEEVQVVGVADSRGLNRAARTQVRNVHCALSGPGLADCTYEARRMASSEDWEGRRRAFVRREQVAPGTPQANGWVAAPHPPEGRTELPVTLMALGLWDPPEAPRIQIPDIPPPPADPDNETQFAQLAPSEWARALSSAGGDAVSPKRIRSVTCVGLETSYMLCGWEQRFGVQWRRLSQYADISQTNGQPILLIGERHAGPGD